MFDVVQVVSLPGLLFLSVASECIAFTTLGYHARAQYLSVFKIVRALSQRDLVRFFRSIAPLVEPASARFECATCCLLRGYEARLRHTLIRTALMGDAQRPICAATAPVCVS